MEATLVALIGLGGAVITYLAYENRRMKRENWQLLQVIYENAEAMKTYAGMRRQDGPGSGP